MILNHCFLSSDTSQVLATASLPTQFQELFFPYRDRKYSKNQNIKKENLTQKIHTNKHTVHENTKLETYKHTRKRPVRQKKAI